jgi:hypothetical protein
MNAALGHFFFETTLDPKSSRALGKVAAISLAAHFKSALNNPPTIINAFHYNANNFVKSNLIKNYKALNSCGDDLRRNFVSKEFLRCLNPRIARRNFSHTPLLINDQTKAPSGYLTNLLTNINLDEISIPIQKESPCPQVFAKTKIYSPAQNQTNPISILDRSLEPNRTDKLFQTLDLANYGSRPRLTPDSHRWPKH